MYQRRCPSHRPLYHLSKFGEPLFSLLCEEHQRLLLQLHRRTLLCLGPKLPERPVRHTLYSGRPSVYGEHLLFGCVLRRHLLRFRPDLPEQSDVLRTCERLRLELSACAVRYQPMPEVRFHQRHLCFDVFGRPNLQQRHLLYRKRGLLHQRLPMLLE
jgi:hypothetical protein